MRNQMLRHAVFSGHQGAVYTVAPSTKTGFFLSGGSDATVVEWDLSEQIAPRIIARSASLIYSLLALPNQDVLFIGNNQGGIHVIDLEQKKEIHYWLAHKTGVFDLKFHAHKNEIWAAGADGNLSIWDASSFENKAVIQVSDQKIRKIEHCSNYSCSALACSDGSIYLVYSQRTIESISPQSDAVNALAFSPDGKYLLSGTKNAHLQIWDWPNRKLLEQIPAHNFAIYGIQFINAGEQFITFSRDKTIKLWETASFNVIQRIDRETLGHVNSVNAGFWDAHSSLFISGSDDRSAIAWRFNN